MADPVLVEVIRGGRVESTHCAAFVVADSYGRVVHAMGDGERPVFPRSAAKPLQALALVASGAADRFGLAAADIAIACGSHLGEPDHVATVEGFLATCGHTPAELECGTHWPLSEAAARDLAARGVAPTPLHNNCSGKHAGLLCLARHLGVEPAGYVRPDHPAMRLVTGAIETACGTTLDASCMEVDGCSIPAYAFPLRCLATAFARLATGQGLPGELAHSAARIRAAVASQPRMIGGTNAFDTRVAEVCGEGAMCKSGAEGVAAIAIPSAGLGIAIKVADGSGRAIEPLAAALIARFFFSGPSAVIGTLASWSELPLHNWNGTVVGSLRAVPGW
jgi:L-asparaginase II